MGELKSFVRLKLSQPSLAEVRAELGKTATRPNIFPKKAKVPIFLQMHWPNIRIDAEEKNLSLKTTKSALLISENIPYIALAKVESDNENTSINNGLRFGSVNR